MIRFAVAFLILLPGLVQAQTLAFPSNASLTREVTSTLDGYAFPTGPWTGADVPTRMVEGALTQQAWRIATTSLTSLQMIRPLREQLRNDRFEVLFECADTACGGFDFRFALNVLPPPDMQVALGDFRFLTARRIAESETEMISVLVSRTAQAGYVQVTHVAPQDAGLIAPLATTEAEPPREDGSNVAAQLAETGRAVLSDLTFETGSAQLAGGEFAELSELARFLQADRSRRIALVGHTDASGDLEPNIALSQRRAASVLERLVAQYAISRSQLTAQGVGYLVPLAPNATEQGRAINRRVEAVLLLPSAQ